MSSVTHHERCGPDSLDIIAAMTDGATPIGSLRKALSDVEEELQRDLSAFQESVTENREDESSIASEVEHLHSIEESIREELLELDGFWPRWRLGGSWKPRKSFTPGDGRLPSLVYTDSSSSDESSSSEHCTAHVGTDETSSILESLLRQGRGFGGMSLALSSDVLASQFLDSSKAPILQPWLRHQLEKGLPASLLSAEWLLSVPLLGTLASAVDGRPDASPQKVDNVRGGEIKEIVEED